MASKSFSRRIADLFQQGKWSNARTLLERELVKDPEDHWLLTQLGVTFYEQREYAKAEQLFLQSYKILSDCPLTLWNLAGTLDALGKYKTAIGVYTWLLNNTKSSKDDPCWESKSWTDSLKTDCVYRLGTCLEKSGKTKEALHCYRNYLQLLSVGVTASYSAEAVIGRIRKLERHRTKGSQAVEVRRAMQSAVREIAHGSTGPVHNEPPLFDELRLLQSGRVISRR